MPQDEKSDSPQDSPHLVATTSAILVVGLSQRRTIVRLIAAPTGI
jgi:hypothetical protein